MSSGLDLFVTAALLRQQLVLHLLARLGARTWILISPFGWANTPQLRLLVGVFMIYDLVLAVGIWHERVSVPIRWLLDTADVTFWALLCPDTVPYTAAVVVAVPLLVIIPVRRGIQMATVAAVGITGAVVSARVMSGAQAFAGDTLLYLGMSIILGAIVSRVLRTEANRQRAQAEAYMQADLVAAALAGRNDVVTGVGRDAIDDLQTSIMRLTLAQVDAAAELRKAVAEHKLRLGEETRTEAVYLRDALDGYAGERRAREPAVSKHVFFDVAGQDAVQVLSHRQAKQLVEQTATAGLTGEVPVRVLRTGSRGSLVVELGFARVTLAPTSEARVRLPIAPIAIVGLALYVLTMSNPNYSEVPLPVTIPLAGIVLAYALVGFALVRRFGQRIEPWVAVSTLGPFLMLAWLIRDVATSPAPDRLTLLGPLAGVGLLMGIVVQPRAAVAAAWICFVIASLTVVWSAPPLPARYVVSEFIWPLIAFLGAHLTGRAVRHLGENLSKRVTENGAVAVEQRRQRAREVELRYLWEILERGETLCRRAEPGPILAQVIAELHSIRRVLEAQTASS